MLLPKVGHLPLVHDKLKYGEELSKVTWPVSGGTEI